jgi:hypothetical protein
MGHLAGQDTCGVGATVALLLVELLTGKRRSKGVRVYGKVNLGGYLAYDTDVKPLHLERCFGAGVGAGAGLVILDEKFLSVLRDESPAVEALVQAGKVRGVSTMWQVLEWAYAPPV